MNGVVLALALSVHGSQFDMSGSDLMMSGMDMNMSGHEVATLSPVPLVPLKPGDSFGPPPPPPDDAVITPIVFAYYAPFHCQPCELAKNALAVTKLLAVKTRATPDWVSTFPTFHWQQSDGEWRKCSGWPGRIALESMVLRTWGEQAEAQPNPARTAYRQRSSSSVGVEPNTRSNVLRHLLQDGIHRGRFDNVEATLRTMTHRELLAVHSDHHNGMVDWAYFGRQTQPVQHAPRRSVGCSQPRRKSFLGFYW